MKNNIKYFLNEVNIFQRLDLLQHFSIITWIKGSYTKVPSTPNSAIEVFSYAKKQDLQFFDVGTRLDDSLAYVAINKHVNKISIELIYARCFDKKSSYDLLNHVLAPS